MEYTAGKAKFAIFNLVFLRFYWVSSDFLDFHEFCKVFCIANFLWNQVWEKVNQNFRWNFCPVISNLFTSKKLRFWVRYAVVESNQKMLIFERFSKEMFSIRKDFPLKIYKKTKKMNENISPCNRPPFFEKIIILIRYTLQQKYFENENFLFSNWRKFFPNIFQKKKIP